MMTAPNTPQLRPFVGEAIPAELKQHKRWAPWRAVWNAKRQKYDKVPHRADRPDYGLSTAKPDQWFDYDVALAAYRRNPERFAGIGYVMTGQELFSGVDLDNCVVDGVLAPWAAEVVEQLASYTEISPSGNGLRIMLQGHVADDWTNHDIGIEVYGGNEARFLTVTGEHLADTPLMVRTAPAGALQALEARYAVERRRAEVIDLNMPDVVDDLLLPSLENLDIPYAARDFLDAGTHRGDRSRELFSTAVALYASGLPDDEVFSILAYNQHAMEIALDHRRQDHDRALLYLWREHCCKGKARAAPRITADDFEDVSPPPASRDLSPIKPIRFQFQPAATFIQGEDPEYLVDDVIPQAGLVVVFGESGSGKSFFMIDVSAAIAAGRRWRDKAVKQGTVAYICAEGAGGFKRRLRAYAEHHDIDLAHLPIEVLGDTPNLMETTDVRDLVAALKLVKPSVIVVDTFAQSFVGNENSGEDMGRALKHCRVLHKTTGAPVILVHHSGKDASKGARGWSGLRAAADAEIEIVRAGDDRAATVSKMKDGEDGQEFGFKLVTVALGANARGREVTSCVVEHTQTVARADRKKEPKGAKEKLVLKVAQDMVDLGGTLTVNVLIDAVVNQIPHDEGEGKRDRRREVVLRAIESLIEANRLSTAGGVVHVE
jgi:hypothetical protein